MILRIGFRSLWHAPPSLKRLVEMIIYLIVFKFPRGVFALSRGIFCAKLF
jgi:hypothetical protein